MNYIRYSGRKAQSLIEESFELGRRPDFSVNVFRGHEFVVWGYRI